MEWLAGPTDPTLAASATASTSTNPQERFSAASQRSFGPRSGKSVNTMPTGRTSKSRSSSNSVSRLSSKDPVMEAARMSSRQSRSILPDIVYCLHDRASDTRIAFVCEELKKFPQRNSRRPPKRPSFLGSERSRAARGAWAQGIMYLISSFEVCGTFLGFAMANTLLSRMMVISLQPEHVSSVNQNELPLICTRTEWTMKPIHLTWSLSKSHQRIRSTDTLFEI